MKRTSLVDLLSAASRAVKAGRHEDAWHLLNVSAEKAAAMHDEIRQLQHELKRVAPPPVAELDLPAFLHRQAD